MTDYIQTIRKKIGHDRLLIAGAGVFVYQDGRVLLQKRRDNGLWALHGGCVELGERVEDTAKRELLEETGLTANALELLGVFSGDEMLYTYPNGDEVYIISVLYICRDFAGTPLPETNETLGLRWFRLDRLPPSEEISPPDRVPLRAFVEHIKRGG